MTEHQRKSIVCKIKGVYWKFREKFKKNQILSKPILSHRFILIFALVLPKDKVKFSGMNPGDIVRVTVMEEMNHLNISRDKPLDLIAKPWNLAKKNKLFWSSPLIKGTWISSLRFYISISIYNSLDSITTQPLVVKAPLAWQKVSWYQVSASLS